MTGTASRPRKGARKGGPERDDTGDDGGHRRDLHRRIDPNADERARTHANETKDETTRARLLAETTTDRLWRPTSSSLADLGRHAFFFIPVNQNVVTASAV
ncbi:MAG: hypothetical protein QOJ06_14 [Pseudonocardiales bacterium]|jgi:hypothetical protein|nr:hypothetical protein [Pseudonocardiales bacterium]